MSAIQFRLIIALLSTLVSTHVYADSKSNPWVGAYGQIGSLLATKAIFLKVLAAQRQLAAMHSLTPQLPTMQMDLLRISALVINLVLAKTMYLE